MMKQQGKKLRDALEDIRTEVNCATFAPEDYDLFGTLRLIGQKATDALEAPSEMQQLVEWLEAKSGTPYNTALDQGWEMAFKVILRHIRTEFLRGEKTNGL